MLRNILAPLKNIMKEHEPDSKSRIKETPAEFLLRLGPDLINFIVYVHKISAQKEQFRQHREWMKKEILTEIACHDNAIFTLCISDQDLVKDCP